MTSSGGEEPVHQRLIQILDNDKALAALLSLPGDAMTQPQKEVLLVLTQHFSAELNVNGTEEGTEDDNHCPHRRRNSRGHAENPQKRKRTERPVPRNPWGQFMNLESLSLTPAFQQHFNKYGPNPQRFLTDNSLLKNRVAEFASETVGDVFMACYEYMLHLESRRTKDSLRWCFTMLMYFDLIKLIKPNRSGRVGCLMQKEVTKFLGPVLGMTTIQPELALKQLNKWSRCGMKLDVLCTKFGPRCLFYLEDLLTQDFLSFKFTARDFYHDKAFAHLYQLDLKKKVTECDVNLFLHTIYYLLSKSFTNTTVRQQSEAHNI